MSDVETLRARIAELMPRAREELSELVAIQSVADPRQFPPQECLRAAEWVADRFAGLGFDDVRLAETPDGSSAVIGSRPCGDWDAPTRCCTPTTTCSPMDEEAWRTPPFRLTEVDGHWYGRGASDCKGDIVMHLTALRVLGHEVPVKLKVVVVGSEEQRTRGLEAFVPEHVDLLGADAISIKPADPHLRQLPLRLCSTCTPPLPDERHDDRAGKRADDSTRSEGQAVSRKQADEEPTD